MHVHSHHTAAVTHWCRLLLDDIICSVRRRWRLTMHCNGVMQQFSQFCPWWPWLLTFKLVRARDQTPLPCKFGANPFSYSRDIWVTNKKKLITDSAKNRTLLACGNNRKLYIQPRSWRWNGLQCCHWKIPFSWADIWTGRRTKAVYIQCYNADRSQQHHNNTTAGTTK